VAPWRGLERLFVGVLFKNRIFLGSFDGNVEFFGAFEAWLREISLDTFVFNVEDTAMLWCSLTPCYFQIQQILINCFLDKIYDVYGVSNIINPTSYDRYDILLKY